MGDQRSGISKKMKDLTEFGVDNVTRLRLSQADDFSPTCWLDNLKVGDSFISQARKRFNVWLEEYTIMGKQDNLTLLRENKRTGTQDESTWDWTDNEVFCNENDLKKVL